MILLPGPARGHPARQAVPTRWRAAGPAHHGKDRRSRTQLVSLHGRGREVLSVSQLAPRSAAYDLAPPAAISRGCLAPRGRVRREPDVRQQLVELSEGHGWQAKEDVLEISEGIDVVVLAGAGEGVQDGRRP